MDGETAKQIIWIELLHFFLHIYKREIYAFMLVSEGDFFSSLFSRALPISLDSGFGGFFYAGKKYTDTHSKKLVYNVTLEKKCIEANLQAPSV